MGFQEPEKSNELESVRQPAPSGLILADQQRPEGGREASDAAGQRHLRRQRPGRFPAALLERLPVGNTELRGHYVRPRSTHHHRFLAFGPWSTFPPTSPSCLPAPATSRALGFP